MASAGCFPLHPLQEMAKRAAEEIEGHQGPFQQIAGLATGATAMDKGGPGFLKDMLREIQQGGESRDDDEEEPPEQDNGRTAGSSGLNGRKTLMAHADVEDLWIF